MNERPTAVGGALEVTTTGQVALSTIPPATSTENDRSPLSTAYRDGGAS